MLCSPRYVFSTIQIGTGPAHHEWRGGFALHHPIKSPGMATFAAGSHSIESRVVGALGYGWADRGPKALRTCRAVATPQTDQGGRAKRLATVFRRPSPEPGSGTSAFGGDPN